MQEVNGSWMLLTKTNLHIYFKGVHIPPVSSGDQSVWVSACKRQILRTEHLGVSNLWHIHASVAKSDHHPCPSQINQPPVNGRHLVLPTVHTRRCIAPNLGALQLLVDLESSFTAFRYHSHLRVLGEGTWAAGLNARP